MNIKTGIVIADAHAPEHDPVACSIVRQVIEDEAPDYVIELGDQGEFSSVNHHLKYKRLLLEGARLAEDIDVMLKVSEEYFEVYEDCKYVKLIGNHENWVAQYIEKFPELQGVREFDIQHRYREAGWEVVPWGEFYNVGKIMFHHGDRIGYQSKHHAAQWAQLGTSVIYAHRHSVQRDTQETIRRDCSQDKHGAWSVGCLRLPDPEWMHNRRNNWQQGFGFFYLLPTGNFAFYPIDITEGVAIWNGKIYKGE